MPTANDRLKARFNNVYWTGVGAAVLLHFMLFLYTPVFGAPRYDTDASSPLIVQPLAADLPPEPEPIPRPARPIIGDATLDDPALTIPSVPFERFLPPPPPARTTASDDAALRAQFEAFVPSMVAPRVLNALAVQRAMQQHYPALLREAGIGGDASVELWLDETGAIVRSRIARSSGYTALDSAALKVADVMQLTPAKNRGRAVKVIVSVPIQFRVH